jgi:hypothetical protein
MSRTIHLVGLLAVYAGGAACTGADAPAPVVDQGGSQEADPEVAGSTVTFSEIGAWPGEDQIECAGGSSWSHVFAVSPDASILYLSTQGHIYWAAAETGDRGLPGAAPCPRASFGPYGWLSYCEDEGTFTHTIHEQSTDYPCDLYTPPQTFPSVTTQADG